MTKSFGYVMRFSSSSAISWPYVINYFCMIKQRLKNNMYYLVFTKKNGFPPASEGCLKCFPKKCVPLAGLEPTIFGYRSVKF